MKTFPDRTSAAHLAAEARTRADEARHATEAPKRRSASAAFLARHGLGDPATAAGLALSPEAGALGECAWTNGDAWAAWANDPDHHLWRNGRRYWVAFTVVEDGWRQERVRVSLGTDCRAEARRRRDALLARIEAVPGCALSLRAANRRRGEERAAARARRVA